MCTVQASRHPLQKLPRIVAKGVSTEMQYIMYVRGYIYMQNVRTRFKKTKTNVCLINLVFHLGFTRLPTTTKNRKNGGGGGGAQIFRSTR